MQIFGTDVVDVLAVLGSVVTTASLVAATTPTPKDDTIIAILYKVIDFLAINVGRAKDR